LGDAGALRRAISVPFKEATKPSSYFASSTTGLVLKATGSATRKLARREAVPVTVYRAGRKTGWECPAHHTPRGQLH